MAKKHCSKHASYYYRCPDCRQLNEEPGSSSEPNESPEPEDSGRRLYSDAFDEDGAVRIPVEGQERPIHQGPPNAGNGGGKPPRRYYGGYTKITRNKKKIAVITLLAAAIITFVILIWAIPSWLGSISLQQQLYSNKAGSFNYWQYYTLSGWSSNFFFNKIGLLTGIIGMIIMIVPVPDRALLSLIGERRGRPKPSLAKCYLFWAPVGFGVFYIVGQLIDVVSQFGWGAYLIEQGAISTDITTIGNALRVLYDPTSLDMSTIFAYQYYWLPIINLIFACIIVRFVLAAIEYSVLKQNYVLAIAYGLTTVGIIFGIIYFNLPLSSVDGLAQIQYWSVLLGFVCFLVFGILVLLMGKLRSNQLTFDRALKKKSLIIGAGILVVMVIPLFISIPTAISIDQDSNVWTSERWQKQIQKEIAWTQIAAGTDQINRSELSSLVSGEHNSTKDTELLDAMRLFDKTYAYKLLLPQLKTEETLADADIVYIGDAEYWVAPKTVDWVELSNAGSDGSVQLHTNLYDHVEGFYAVSTHNNVILDNTTMKSIFNVSNNYPIFFGENQALESFSSDYSSDYLLSEDSGVIWAYDQDILLSTEWGGTEISGYSYQWNMTGGTPDGTLTGLERFWYTANLGLFSYAVSQLESSYLINRNVMTRVESILYPGISVDPDPYLVFDTTQGRVYYAVSLYVDMPIRSFAQSNIMRFLGVCLVDVMTGTLRFIKNPQYLTAPTNDPTYNFWKIYYEGQFAYAWEATIPDWFMAQYRYPESLIEAQLAVDYTYHVTNPSNWRRGDAWYQRPTDGDLYYIETILETEMEYVGVDLVERYGGNTKTLAGLYAVRHGSHFGEIVFYSADSLAADPIGPETAQTVLANDASEEYTLIGSRRLGNVLLYPLAGSLYYLIPVYKAPTGTSTVETLRLAGFVNATDRVVAYGYGSGNVIQEAFDALNISYVATIESNVTLSYSLGTTSYWNGTSTTDADFTSLQFSIYYKDLGTIYDKVSVTVNITVHGNKSIVKQYGDYAKNTTFYKGPDSQDWWCNYTVGEWIDLSPGMGATSTVKITSDIGTYNYGDLYYDIYMYVTSLYDVTTSAVSLRHLTIYHRSLNL